MGQPEGVPRERRASEGQGPADGDLRERVPRDRIYASCEDDKAWRFVGDRLGLPYQLGTWSMVREVDGEIVGAWAYNNFTPMACQVHFAGAYERWLTKDFLWKAFHVPFEQWGLLTLMGIIVSGNERSVRVAKKLGFEIFGTLPDAHPDGDLLFHRMHRSNCRWLELPRR